MEWLAFVVAGALGYLIGSIPTGYIVVKQLTGQDIRQFGSGGTGATNVRRVAGGKAALFVLFFDLHKGLVPVILARLLFPIGAHDDPSWTWAGITWSGWAWLHVLVALATVVGHSKSMFLKFSGGKSAATGLGGVLGLAPVPALLIALVAFVVAKMSRYVSLGSIVASIVAPFALYYLHAPLEYVLYTSVAALYVIYLHKSNISRLLSGTENRL